MVSRQVVTECAEFRALLEDPRFYWLAHNAPVDAHAVGNEGITLGNVINTLTMARWTWPHRARRMGGAAFGGGFGLDALGKDVLGEGKLEHFNELFTENIETWETKERLVKWCACGATACRKRTRPFHEKFSRLDIIQEPKLIERKVPLEEVIPGHFLFDRALRYAAQDAVLAFALYHIMLRLNNNTIREVPWV